jgi:epoxide hydrolase-like predicted phosphatase
MIKAVIFDLNGLFIQSPNLSDRFQKEFNVPTEKFLVALKDIMPKVRMPDVQDTFSYWEPYLKKWSIKLSKEEFFDFWFGAEEEVVELVKIARELKNKGIKIFILSNNFKERSIYYARNFSFLEMFDKVYYSWQTGFAKPDTKAFENLLKENNLEPNKCIYFDDSKNNVESAKSLGINAFVFENAENLKKLIEENL